MAPVKTHGDNISLPVQPCATIAVFCSCSVPSPQATLALRALLATTFGDTSRLDVRVGDQLVAGAPLGIAAPTNPSVMLELRRGGEPVNPLRFVG